jgi:hypothetical protein
MAAPNILNVTSIYGRTNLSSVSATTTNVVTNLAGSSTVIKINSLHLSNFNVSPIAANVGVNRNANTFLVAAGTSVPAYSTLTVIAKDTAIYLEEGDVLQANCSSNTNVQVICSYEIIG